MSLPSLHIERSGSGPDLVLLHGWAMHGGIFAPLVESLRARWTVHVVDLPGHGFSRDALASFDLPTIAEQVLAQVPTAPWLGWSLGGLVAQYAALNWPGRVPGLVAVASSPRFIRSPDWPQAVDASLIREFGADLGRDWRATVERFLALEVIGSDDARTDLRTLRAHLFDRGEPAPEVLVQGLELLEHSDLRAQLPQLQVPSLWIAGRRDRLVPAASLSAAATLAPQGQVMVIDGAGHAPFLQHADRIAAAIGDFAGGLS